MFGVTLAFINADIVVTALAIGCATLLMAIVGILIGRIIGEKFGRIQDDAASSTLPPRDDRRRGHSRENLGGSTSRSAAPHWRYWGCCWYGQFVSH